MEDPRFLQQRRKRYKGSQKSRDMRRELGWYSQVYTTLYLDWRTMQTWTTTAAYDLYGTSDAEFAAHQVIPLYDFAPSTADDHAEDFREGEGVSSVERCVVVVNNLLIGRSDASCVPRRVVCTGEEADDVPSCNRTSDSKDSLLGVFDDHLCAR